MQLKLLLVASILLPMLTSANQEGDTVDSSAEIVQQWKNFKVKFGKSYATAAEETSRKKIFFQTLKEIQAHNALYSKGLTSYTTGINQFSDMEDWEFSNLVACNVLPSIVRDSTNANCELVPNLPTDIDWRQSNHVTAVGDQGECGACWAFAATGALEALMARTTGKTVPVALSEQNLIDCSSTETFGNKGCEGGSPDRAFGYVMKEEIHSDASYPYTERVSTCENPSGNTAGRCVDFNITSGEFCIQNFVGITGPIAVTMIAPSSLKNYNGSIIDDPIGCGQGGNHSALIVGYGTDHSKNKDYWIIKNSWNETWGDRGYMKVVRNKEMCGIGRFATYPIGNDSTSSYESASVIYILLMRLFINFL